MLHRTSVDSRLSHSQEQVSVGEEVHRTLEGLLPWAVSVLMHMGIVLIAFFVVWSAGQTVMEEDVIVTLRPADRANDPLVDTRMMQPTDSPQVPLNVPTKESAAGRETSPVRIEKVRMDLNTIGMQSAPVATFGRPQEKGGGGVFDIDRPPAGEEAKTVVFCVDASGSMVDSFAYVIWDLREALSKLKEDQRFTVIFFQAGSALEVPVPARGYKRATAENVKAVRDWISLESGHVSPRGATDPVSAVKLALGYQPQMMYLLSDNITGRGRYQVDRGELVSLIDRLQTSHRVRARINTIQFLYPDALGTLDEIAKKNGGTSRFVDESLLNPTGRGKGGGDDF